MHASPEQSRQEGARARPENSAVMGCLESQFNKVQAELKDIRTLGGAVGVKAWCDLQFGNFEDFLR